MAARKKTGGRGGRKGARKRQKAPARRIVSVSLDLDQLERLYRRTHGLDGNDGDTKAGARRGRRRRLAGLDGNDGDTKAGARRGRRRRLAGLDGNDGDTKGGITRGHVRRRGADGGDTKGTPRRRGPTPRKSRRK